MTRILLVTSLLPTADRPEAGIFVARRVQALRDQGVTVEVIAARSYRHGPIRRHLRMVVDAARPRRVDGVEAHVFLPAGLIGLLAARLARAPLLVYAHGSDVRETALRSRLHVLLARLVARFSTVIVSNSEATRAAVAELGATGPVIPPGVDFDVFSPAPTAHVRLALGLPERGSVVVYVGSLTRLKGADVFAEAMAAVPTALGIAVGRGDLGEMIAARWPSIRLVGPATQEIVARWMQAADLVIVPSRAEGLGLAAVEALACGVPVVACSVGGLVEVVTDEFNGILVQPDDPAALRAAVERLLRSDDLRGQLASNARASVAHHDRRIVDRQMAGVWKSMHVDT